MRAELDHGRQTSRLPRLFGYIKLLSKLLSKYYLSRMIVIMERYEVVGKSTDRPVVLVVPRGDLLFLLSREETLLPRTRHR